MTDTTTGPPKLKRDSVLTGKRLLHRMKKSLTVKRTRTSYIGAKKKLKVCKDQKDIKENEFIT